MSMKIFNESLDKYCKNILKEETSIFHNDNGTDYEIIERSSNRKNCLLKDTRGNKWVVAWNCPEDNQGSWGQGHYFFDEKKAREVWEDKYKNESLKEDVDYNSIQFVKDYKDDILDIFNRNSSFSSSGAGKVLDSYIETRSDDYGKYDALVVECDNSNSMYVGYLEKDLVEFCEEHNLDFEHESNDNGFYGRTYAIYSLDGIDESLSRKIRSILSKLNEAEMSDEDRRKSDLLRSAYNKLLNRVNAKLSPEEQAVIDELGLERFGRDLTLKGNHDARLFGGPRYPDNRGRNWKEANLVDKAKKMGPRQDADRRHGGVSIMRNYNLPGDTYQELERRAENAAMQMPVRKMKSALLDRKYNDDRLASVDTERDSRLADLETQRQRIIDQSEENKKYYKKTRDMYQGEIDDLLKRRGRQEESLKEGMNVDYTNIYNKTKVLIKGLLDFIISNDNLDEDLALDKRDLAVLDEAKDILREVAAKLEDNGIR